jgi:hypothetical protein
LPKSNSNSIEAGEKFKTMGKKEDYSKYLRQTLSNLIDQLDLSELRKDFLKNRWLDQVMWLEGRATKERNAHHNLRMITIIGGVIVPALIGFQKGDQKWQEIIGWTAFGLSQVVAVSAAIEEFFGHGEKYRNYRNTAEGLKIEGWQFFQMAGPYRQFQTHTEAYTIFAERVEQYIQQDLQGFISQLTERQEAGDKQAQETVTKNAELALEKLNEQLQLRAQYEAQMRELEAEKQRVQAEKQRVQAEKQHLEQERSAPQESDNEKPSLLAGEEKSDQQPDLIPVGNLWQYDAEDRDSTK